MTGTTGVLDLGSARVDVTAGGVHVHQYSTDVQPPENTRYDWARSWTADTDQDTGDLSTFNHAIVNISGLTAETVQITALVDGAGSVESLPVLVRKTDGTFSAASALGNGIYYVPLGFWKLRFDKSAAAETVVVTCSFKQTGVGI